LVTLRRPTKFKILFDFIKQSSEAAKFLDGNFFLKAFRYADDKILLEIMPFYFSSEMTYQDDKGNTCLHLLVENYHCNLVVLESDFVGSKGNLGEEDDE